MSTLAQSIALAIQKQEGFGQPDAVTLNANNNPGGLISWPGFPTVNGFAQFPDYQTGFNAVVANVQGKIDQGMTLSQLTEAFAEKVAAIEASFPEAFPPAAEPSERTTRPLVQPNKKQLLAGGLLYRYLRVVNAFTRKWEEFRDQMKAAWRG